MTDKHHGHRIRVLLIGGFILALFVGLLGRLALIQGVDAEHYQTLARRQYRVRMSLRVRRGSIRDRMGRELAVSAEVPSIFANPRFISDKARTARALARLLDIDGEALRRRLARRPAEAVVQRKLSPAEEEELRGAGVLDHPRRPLFIRESGPGERELWVRPARVRDAKKLAETLGPILHRDRREVRLDLEAYRHFVWVERKVTEAERRRVQQSIREESRRRALHMARERQKPPSEREAPPPQLFAGIGIMSEYRRLYADGGLAAQLIGFVGIDENGLEGLELVLDERLAGEPGEVVFRRDASGHYISTEGLPRTAPVPGSDVELTLDAVIQSYVETVLDETMALWAPAAASAVVIDPHTGDLLAAAARPTFDPNDYEEHDAAALKRRARARYIVDWMEPGSIMKPFVISAALSEGLVSEKTVIFCENGVWRLGSRRFHDHHAYGNLTAAEVIVKSSNIGAAKLGTRVGARRLHRYLSRFGFGRPTGCILPGENPGLLRPPERWRPGYSLPSISIGQEICVNVLQMALGYSAIANGGVLMRPRLVRRVIHPDGRVQERQVHEVGRAIPSDVARRVRRVLCRVVEEGTGRRAKLELWSVGGKTGTAQKPRPGGGYSHSKVICSFVALAPAADPRVVVMVSVDEPTKRTAGRHFGGTVAAPAVADILRRSLAYLGVPPDKPQTLARLGLTEDQERTN